MIPRTVSRLWWRRYLSRNATSWQDLETFPRLSPDQQRRELARRLLDQIRYFGAREDSLPEWRDAARIQDPDELWSIWPQLPILSKKDLKDRFPSAEMQTRFGLIGQQNVTGGSTGEPVHFFHDVPMMRSASASLAYSALQMGWSPGMPTIIVWGSERDIRKELPWKNRLNGKLRNEALVDGYQMSDATVDRVLALAQHGPVAIYGFTTMLEFVSRRVLETGRSLPPGKVATAWNGGEMLFPEQSELFRRAFGVPIFNRYGGRELAIMACQFTGDGPLNVFRPWVHLEVVNQQGRPAAPGESGRLVWTSTICRGTPFLRYDVGDIGVFSAAQCDESGVFAIDQLQGRVAGLLELPDGRTINNLYWNHCFKDIKEIQQFQVILKSDKTIRILLKGEGFTPDREQYVRAVLNQLLRETPIEFVWVDAIPLTKQGKLLQVMREGA